MKTGPPPTPTNLRVLRGNPGKRPLPVTRIKPAPGAECPAWLSAAAREEWKRTAPELERLGLLAAVDQAAFAVYCEAWAEFRWATEEIRRRGRTGRSVKGNDVPRPAVHIRRMAMQKIREFSAEFGITPASRTRLELAAAGEDGSDADRFFGGAQKKEPPKPGA